MITRRHLIIAALVVCLGFGIAWAVKRPGGDAAGLSAFTAMTCNVGDVGPRRFPVAGAAGCILSQGRPDILFLQEAPDGTTGAAFQAKLGYPYVTSAPARRGKLGGLRVLSRFPIEATREIVLPSDGKGAGALCATLNIDGQRVTACSIHLDEVDPKPRNADGQVVFSVRQAWNFTIVELFTDTVRTAAAWALIDALGDQSEAMPVILAGDFNTVPGSRTIRRMTDHYRDVLWPGADWFCGTYHKVAFPLSPRIDYIFVSNRLSVDSARVLCRSAGDHYPVTARFKII